MWCTILKDAPTDRLNDCAAVPPANCNKFEVSSLKLMNINSAQSSNIKQNLWIMPVAVFSPVDMVYLCTYKLSKMHQLTDLLITT